MAYGGIAGLGTCVYSAVVVSATQKVVVRAYIDSSSARGDLTGPPGCVFPSFSFRSLVVI